MKIFLRITAGFILGLAAAAGGIYLYGKTGETENTETAEIPAEAGAAITYISGYVYILRDGDTIQAASGDVLEDNDVLKVTEGSYAQVQFSDRGSARLGEDTLVKFLKLTGSDKKLDVRTEILTGSLSYKVKKLNSDESIIIIADGTEYKVKGTEFLIRKEEEQTLLVVEEGSVLVKSSSGKNEFHVGPKEQLNVVRGSDITAPEKATEENLKVLKEASPLPEINFLNSEKIKQITVEITTIPPDAEIYIDGLKTGKGIFSGIIPQGTLLDVRIRKRGFKDYSFSVNADKNQYIKIPLVPAGINETLNEKKEQDPALKHLREEYERKLLEIRSKYENENSSYTEELERVKAEREKREAEINRQLETQEQKNKELEQENSKLKELITQIQELAENKE